MITHETGRINRKKFQTIQAFIQSILIFILIILVAFMMLHIHNLQGTARVINYAGLVRGATQRIVKLEISGRSDHELTIYVDNILTELKYEDGIYELTSLEDKVYQEKLNVLMNYWSELKDQIVNLHNSSYSFEETELLVDMSETFFQQANEMVFAAENYSNKIAKHINILEILSVIDMCLLVLIITSHSITAVKMRKLNTALKQKAYIDTATGLKNKNMCEELLNTASYITEPTACIMFDMNNLKITNDNFGHSAGDKLIADFANILSSVVRENDFAGRCGGDEFLLILYNADRAVVDTVITRIQNKTDEFNRTQDTIPISYAYGYAFSSNFADCTYRKLFDEADRCMYTNKHKIKAEAAAKSSHSS